MIAWLMNLGFAASGAEAPVVVITEHRKRTFTIERQDRSFNATRVNRVGTIKRRDRL